MMNSLIRASARNLMFKPPTRPAPSAFRADERNVMLKSIDGEHIHCCLLCPWGHDTELQDYKGTKSLVIFMHGNADDVVSSKSYAQWLADHMVMNVLVFDYPGYGYSSGDASEEGMEDAAVAVMEYATSKLKHSVSDIFVYGKSIGSYPAISLAAHPAFCGALRGLVLMSPVASAARCVVEKTVIPNFLMRRLDSVALANIDHIPDVHTLILFVHGSEDDIVPIEHSHALLAAASPHTYYPPLWLEAGHNDIECLHQNLLVASIIDFVKECERRDVRRHSSACPYDTMTP
jgi:abhydrolase domain-containing protein 17